MRSVEIRKVNGASLIESPDAAVGPPAAIERRLHRQLPRPRASTL